MQERRFELLSLLLASTISFAEAPRVAVQPGSVISGTDQTVSISVQADRGRGPLRAIANVGQLRGPEDTPAGWRFTWSPPPTHFPQIAVLLFWVEEQGVPPEVAAVRVSLVGRTLLRINTEPGADVRVQIGQSSFGPQRADKRGHVDVPIEVPPGVLSAQVTAQSRDRTTTRGTPLDVPPDDPLLAAFSPSALARGERAWLIVAHSGPLDASPLQVDMAGGTAERQTAPSGQALFRITPFASAAHVSASVSLRGQRTARAAAEAEVQPGALAPEQPGIARFSGGASVGGFYSGGANSGLAVAIAGGYLLPALAQRLSIEAELGFRSSTLSTTVAGLGRVDSRLSGILLELAARALISRWGAWAVHGRVGAGTMPFWISTRSDFQPPFTQSGAGFEAFAAVQVGRRVQELELFGEIRGAFAPATTPNLSAGLGGGLLLVGARYGGGP